MLTPRCKPYLSYEVQRTTQHAYLLLAVALFALCLVSGCGLKTRAQALAGGKLTLATRVCQDANQNSPVSVDILLVYNKTLLAGLETLSARDWFANRDQYRRDDPDRKSFEVWGWEWPPNQNIAVELPLKARARAGLIFANYFSPGDHRARFNPRRNFQLTLRQTSFAVQAEDQAAVSCTE